MEMSPEMTPREEALLQFFRGDQGQDPGRAGVGLEHLEGGWPAFLGQLLDDDQRIHQGGAAAAEMLGQADPEQP